MDELCGAWSMESSGLYYSTFEDETLAFAPDGSGWFQFARPNVADVTYFTWSRTAPGQLELAYHERRSILDGKVQERAIGAFPSSISYRVGEEDTPLAGRHLILRIEPPVMSAREFGLRTRDPGTISPERT